MHDPHDNLSSVTDPNGNATTYHFDDFQHGTSTNSPDTGTTSYVYDEAGNMLERADAKGISILYTYDALNRLTHMDFPQDPDVTYTYDEGINGKGRLTGMSDESGTYFFEYDVFGNLTHEEKLIDGVRYRTGYGYDGANLLTHITYPGGRMVRYHRDAVGHASVVNTTMDGMTSTLAHEISHLPFGPLEGLTYGNGITLAKGFDLRYVLSAITTGDLLSLTYTPDPAGHVTSIINEIDPARNQSFAYDDLNRLVNAQNILGSISYTYDGVGNRQSRTEDSLVDTYAYEPGTNRLAEITGAHPESFATDANGNIIAAGLRDFTYNENSRLIGVEENGGALAEYVYNGLGQRIKKVTAAGTTIFHYDQGGKLIAETDQEGNSIKDYVYLDDALLAAVAADESIYYYLTDHLGTPQAMTDEQGQVVWQADYMPLGQTLVSVESVTNNLRFPGQYYDQETGLHYNYFRYYNPTIGRYMTPDPIGFAGGDLTLYGYAVNSPNNKTDPPGLADVGMAWWPSWPPDSSENWWAVDQIRGGYRDFTIIAGPGFGPIYGHICSQGKHYDYLGGGFVAPPGGAAINISPCNPVPGWALAYQVGFGVGFQLGWSFGKEGGFFYEVGLMTPGMSLTSYFVWESVQNDPFEVN